MEEFSKTVEGTRYLHDLYLRAVNSPIRREILNIINSIKQISKSKLLNMLINKGILDDEHMFNYHMDFLIKAFCIDSVNDSDTEEVFYEITQSGKIIEYLE
jgi:hypothetical protein